ncbi:MAG: tetratricopeptide repeat protein [bacterium]|nr:tetratricopeptide repeat protein [bacterium]
MISKSPGNQMAAFNDFLTTQTGLHFSKDRWGELEKAMNRSAGEAGYESGAAYMEQLLSGRISGEHIGKLAECLTVGETYFFRDPEAFKTLEFDLLPQCIRRCRERGHRTFTVWSAACSTGEEPYSIAIVMDKLKKTLKGLQPFILGTDINRESLEKARAGIYGNWSFRGFPQWMKSLYFKHAEADRFVVQPLIKETVTFEYHNLASADRPVALSVNRGVDIIFCRNALMYMAPRVVRRVLLMMYRLLEKDGLLVIGPTDVFKFPADLEFHQESADPPIFRKGGNGCPTKMHIPSPVLEPPVFPEPKEMHPYTFSPEPKEIRSPRVSLESTPGEPVKTDGKYKNSRREALKLFREGKYRQAIEKLKGIPAGLDEPDNQGGKAEIYELLARSFANLGEPEDALKWCRSAVDMDTLNVEYRYLLAMIQLEQGNSADAVKSLKQVLYLEPGHIPANFMLGHLAVRSHDYPGGRRLLDNTLELLASLPDDAPVPGMEEEITTGGLRDIINTIMPEESDNE